MSARRKGKYYERKLVKEFTEAGYEAWLVPLSGALGENNLVDVPDRVRQYLIGDICVNIPNNSVRYIDVPIEVKFRKTASGYKHLYALNQKPIKISQSSTNYVVVFNIQQLTEVISNYSHTQYPTSNIQLSNTVIDWLDQVDILALTAYRKPWIFVVKVK